MLYKNYYDLLKDKHPSWFLTRKLNTTYLGSPRTGRVKPRSRGAGTLKRKGGKKREKKIEEKSEGTRGCDQFRKLRTMSMKMLRSRRGVKKGGAKESKLKGAVSSGESSL